MKLVAATVAVLAAVAFTFSPARAGADGHVNFFLGQKSLNSGDWQPLESQFEFGAVMSFGRDDWPVHIAADVLTSVDEEILNVTLTASTFELDAGVRKSWKAGKVRPYLGGGIGIIGAALNGDVNHVSVDASDAAIGLWADTGVFFRLGSRFNIGLDLRYSSASVDLDYGNGNIFPNVSAGGFHYGLLLGFGW